MERLTFDPPTMPAVFVLSPPRSGSTLLRYILDSHSRIASPGEVVLGRLCSDLRFVLSRTVGSDLPPTREGKERLAAETRRLVAGILEAYARSKGKDVWCDKSPANVEHLESLAEAFPDARYVCLYRGCLDTVKSMLGASQQGFMTELAPFAAKSPGNLVTAMIDAWCHYAGRILDFETAHPASTFRIRYEDMVSDPPAALSPLFEFLGVGWEPEAVERALTAPHDEGGGDLYIRYTRAIDPSGIGKGRSLPFSRVEPALAPMNALLARLGYPAVDASVNSPPAPPAEPRAAAPTGGAGKDGGETVDLGDIFLKRLPATLHERAAEAAKANASVKFVVEGETSGTFWVDLRREPRVLAEDRPADCTLILGGDVLLDIASRRLNPVAAFGQGKVRVQGPLPLAAHVMRFV